MNILNVLNKLCPDNSKIDFCLSVLLKISGESLRLLLMSTINTSLCENKPTITLKQEVVRFLPKTPFLLIIIFIWQENRKN